MEHFSTKGGCGMCREACKRKAGLCHRCTGLVIIIVLLLTMLCQYENYHSLEIVRY